MAKDIVENELTPGAFIARAGGGPIIGETRGGRRLCAATLARAGRRQCLAEQRTPHDRRAPSVYSHDNTESRPRRKVEL